MNDRDQQELTEVIEDGHRLNLLGEFTEALEKFQQAKELSPESYVVWYNLGVVFRNLERRDEAITALGRAIQANPHFVSAWCNRGFAFLETDRLSEADCDFRAAIRISPMHHKAYYGRACVALARGDSVSARQFCQEALRINPDYEFANRMVHQLNQLRSLDRRGHWWNRWLEKIRTMRFKD